MPSKKQSNTSPRGRRRKYRYFLDRNLGSVLLAEQLRNAGLDITVHDDKYQQTERDPWIFYDRGNLGFIVVTSDTAFMKSFPHMAAIHLAKTNVLTFSNNNFKSHARGEAFLKALPGIKKTIDEHAKKKTHFIATVGMTGTIHIRAESPLPSRKTCDPRDWESYARVCDAAGVLVLAPEH